MTLAQFLSDVYESFTIAEAKAEAPAEEKPEEESKEDSKEEEAEEEEEEEEEPEDEMPKIIEECEATKCKSYKHHYDECAERVQQWDDAEEEERKGKRESCVEEYFHLMHCAGECAAPKLWAKLK